MTNHRTLMTNGINLKINELITSIDMIQSGRGAVLF